MNMSYSEFLQGKRQVHSGSGFEPLWLPDCLFGFQRHLCDWAIRQGRAAIFADCGLGKSLIELVWAENVARQTNRPVLILTPLAVSHQFVREGEKFGIECHRSPDGKIQGKIIVTNYERLHYFRPEDFAGTVCDESSILKCFNGRRRQDITEFMRRHSYRLLATATAAPNDYYELGTSSEALGYLGYSDMLTRFFKDEKKDYLGWGRKTYRFRGHAEQPFWRWVCSWARCCRSPADLGFENNGFALPPISEREVLVPYSRPRPGYLISVPAHGLAEQREERRITLRDRCEHAATIAAEHDGHTVLWCHLNPEGTLLAKLLGESIEVAGSMSDEVKEERLLAFQRGEIKRLIVKPRIACHGLNWQHCHNVVTFPSHSWEAHYQSVRRCWRFGQKSPVTVSIVTTEGEQQVIRNLQRKSRQADDMFTSLVRHMNDALHIAKNTNYSCQEELPSWLSSSNR